MSPVDCWVPKCLSFSRVFQLTAAQQPNLNNLSGHMVYVLYQKQTVGDTDRNADSSNRQTVRLSLIGSSACVIQTNLIFTLGLRLFHSQVNHRVTVQTTTIRNNNVITIRSVCLVFLQSVFDYKYVAHWHEPGLLKSKLNSSCWCNITVLSFLYFFVVICYSLLYCSIVNDDDHWFYKVKMTF